MTSKERQWVLAQIQMSVADVRADLELLAAQWLGELRELRRELCKFTGQRVPPPLGEDGGPLQ